MSRAPGCGELEGLYARLLSAYGQQGWWPLRSRAGSKGFDEQGYHPGIRPWPLRPAERFEIAAGAVLTQNTAWRNVEPGLDVLLGRGLLDAEAMLRCPERQLALYIHGCGYHNQKARKLHVLAAWFRGSAVRRPLRGDLRADLLGQWGIGPETADSIALYAFGLPTFVVDAYTVRVLGRLDWLAGGRSYAQVQRLFLESLPAEAGLLGELHALLVRHAKEHCRARPDCVGCPLGRRCPSRQD